MKDRYPDIPVVISGVGLISGLGSGVESNWQGLLAGKGARRPVSLFDVTQCRCQEAAEVDLSTVRGDIPPGRRRRLSRASILAIAAAREALSDACLLNAGGCFTGSQLPLSLSTTGGAMSHGEQFLKLVMKRTQRGQLSSVSRYLPQQQVLDLQEYLDFRGPCTIIANACASGANAIGHGADLIRSGRADCVLSGGYEALTELIYFGFDCLQALSPDCCRPFDINRNGLMLGEGAGFLVLESLEHAQKRGARTYCRLSGYGHATDLHHLTQPSPDGRALQRVMKEAIERSGITPRDIGYINSHGTATPANDGVEAAAYLGFLGDTLPKINSTKAATGHTLGAAGAIEAIVAIQCLSHQQIPPQIGVTDPLPEISAALPLHGQECAELSHVMSVNLGFGGSNAALVFSKNV